MIKVIKKIWSYEIIRYLFAGGCAFIADKLVFYLFNTFILPDMGSWWIIDSVTNALAVLAGFISGTLVNNGLSMFVVFQGEQQKKSRTAKAFWLFTLVGFIGLLLSIGGNQLCIVLFGPGKTKELIYNIIIAIPVTAWNYIGRKFCVRKDKKKEHEIDSESL